MKYLNSTFSVAPPEKLDGIACEACVYGTKHGEKHADTCPKWRCPHCEADWSEILDCDYPECECECHDEDREFDAAMEMSFEAGMMDI